MTTPPVCVADTAYRSASNLALLERRGLKPQFQRKKPRGRKMPAHIARGNATRARVRSRVEHVFAAQKCRLGLVVRTVGMMRARVKIGLANLAYNFTRLAWLNGEPLGVTSEPARRRRPTHQRSTRRSPRGKSRSSVPLCPRPPLKPVFPIGHRPLIPMFRIAAEIAAL